MTREISYASYLLRVWREGDRYEAWRAEIESIQTGQTWRFADPATMLHFLQIQVLGMPDSDRTEGDIQGRH